MVEGERDHLNFAFSVVVFTVFYVRHELDGVVLENNGTLRKVL
jgi:hypothetical protein